MHLEYTPYTLPFLGAALVSMAVALYAWRLRATAGAAAFAVLNLGIAEWVLTYALELAGMDLQTKVFWSRAEYIGLAITQVSWLVFTLEYAGRERWLTRRNLALLVTIPILIQGLVWTNDAHGLIWAKTTLNTSGPVLVVDYTPGALYWLNVAYTYLVLFLGSLLLVRTLLRAPHLYRIQVAVMLVGVSAPWVMSALYFAGFKPYGLEPTPLAFTLTGLALAWGLFRFRLLDMVPAARDAVVESMGDFVIVLDMQGRIVDLNPAAAQRFGVKARDVIGRRGRDVIAAPPDLIERYANATEAHAEIALSAGEVQRHYDMRISPLCRRGRVAGRLVVLRDITERKLAEEALRERNAELQMRNEELDAFTHTVAHDLKAPLSTILGFADMLDQGYETFTAEQVQEGLQTIARSAEKIDRIIEELLLLAGVRRATIQMEPLEMGAIVEEALEQVRWLVKERGATLIVPARDAWPLALGYGPWVEEVWANYLSNALKYGGDPPYVELGATVQADGVVRFWVRDNGRGLTAEEQARLFTPFTRLDQVRVRGHGLGLSIVRRIVERLGGQVGVESEAGQGSVFSFTLPAATEQRPREGTT